MPSCHSFSISSGMLSRTFFKGMPIFLPQCRRPYFKIRYSQIRRW
jgi:hypothetical protein